MRIFKGPKVAFSAFSAFMGAVFGLFAIVATAMAYELVVDIDSPDSANNNDGPNSEFKLSFKRVCVPGEAELKSVVFTAGRDISRFEMGLDKNAMSFKPPGKESKGYVLDQLTYDCWSKLKEIPGVADYYEDDRIVLVYAMDNYNYVETAVLAPLKGPDYIVRILEKREESTRVIDFDLHKTNSVAPDVEIPNEVPLTPAIPQPTVASDSTHRITPRSQQTEFRSDSTRNH